MNPSAIDMFCHWLPRRFLQAAEAMGARSMHMFQRAASIPLMCDLEARFRLMDLLPGYVQVPSLVSPPVDEVAPEQSVELARRVNDEMAEIAQNNRHYFPSFVACLPLNDPDACFVEAERAMTTLGAAGVQFYTNIGGHPIDQPWCLDLLTHIDRLDGGVWLHPLRTVEHPDYVHESESINELWWALGWPHETSLAMGRLALAGLFDRAPSLRILTHHGGGTIPMVAGRFEAGMERMGTRTRGGIAPPLREPPINALRRFHADTASFGHAATIRCAADFFDAGHLLFASDMPFGSRDGWSQVPITLKLLDDLFGQQPDVIDRVRSENASTWLLRRSIAKRPPRSAGTVAHDPT
jgi:uncharacterized protein